MQACAELKHEIKLNIHLHENVILIKVLDHICSRCNSDETTRFSITYTRRFDSYFDVNQTKLGTIFTWI